MLLERGTNINGKEAIMWWTILASSGIVKGDQEAIGTLFERCSNVRQGRLHVDTQTEELGTALLAASVLGHSEVVQMLLGHGVDVNKCGINSGGGST
ncbi:hypothetical protein GGI43DRAFT_385684 [Trichoderma evansii]